MSKNGLENGLDMFQRQQKFLWQQKFQLLKKVTYSRTYLVRSYVKKKRQYVKKWAQHVPMAK